MHGAGLRRFAVEGLPLPKLLEAHPVDTRALESRRSACVTALTAGERR
jgi:hypothetical protein